MLRAAAWTAGLFAVGGGICHVFTAPFVEPVVLLALGTALFVVSGRRAASRAADRADAGDASVEPTRAAR